MLTSASHSLEAALTAANLAPSASGASHHRQLIATHAETPQLTSQYLLSLAQPSVPPGSIETLHALQGEIATLRAQIDEQDIQQLQQPHITRRLEEVVHFITSLEEVGDIGLDRSTNEETLPLYSPPLTEE